MLDEEEWARVEPLLRESIQDVQRYRAQHGVTLPEALAVAHGASALAYYEELTGVRETNVNALWHHRRSEFGPPCTACGKPLRTPRAKVCAACWAPRAES
jgi:hypothetical protein